MYRTIRGAALNLLRLPQGPPSPPPGGALVRTFNASPKYLSYRLLAIWIASGALFLVAGALAIGALFEGWLLLLAAGAVGFLAFLVAFLGYVVNRLDFDLRYYVLTDRSLRIREGVVFLRESTLTFANVQNLRIRRGPLQQLFGIADVLVDTAGGAAGGKDDEGHSMRKSHRGTIHGIENPAEIRDLVLALLKRFRDAGLGDPEDAHHAREGGDPSAARLREILVEVKALRRVLTA